MTNYLADFWSSPFSIWKSSSGNYSATLKNDTDIPEPPEMSIEDGYSYIPLSPTTPPIFSVVIEF